VESFSEQTLVIGPKYVAKCGSMWRLEFESPKPVKSLLFYSTKREPRYGKTSTYCNELPKDARLELCMRVRIFPSFIDSLMKKEEDLFESVPHFISPKKHQQLLCWSAEGK
jgi:hypothetical protein